VRLFKTKGLVRFAHRERITDASLREAVSRAERGLVDADLGGNVIKQRVARTGEGRSSGFRVIVAYRVQNRAVFLYGFAKNERDNITQDELQMFRAIGAIWLTANAATISQALEDGILQEITTDDEET